MQKSKNSISIKARLAKLLILICVLGLLFFYTKHETDNKNYSLQKASFLYEGDKLIGVNTDDKADDLVAAQELATDEVTKDKKGEDVTTNVITSPSLVEFDVPVDEQEQTIDYAKQNTQLLKGGYTLSIDDQYKFYAPDMESIKWTAKEIFLAYVPDKSYLEYYQSTGKFKPFTVDDKTFTGLDISNQVTITEGYQPGSKFVEDKEDLLYDLFHENQTKEYDSVDDNKSIPAIQKAYEMSDTEFKLNNPNLSSDTVSFNGQRVLTNELDPVIDVVQTYETTETEEVEFDTVQQIDENMLQGQFEVTTEGENGEKEITYQNQMVNGEVVSTEEVSEEVTQKPVHQVVTMGEGTVANSVTVDSSLGGIESSEVTSSGFIWPSASKSVTCEYGGYAGHTGIDIQDYYGAPEYAAKAGVVVTSGWSNYGYGYHVVIDHGNGVKTLYAHQNQQPPVSVGQYVEQGQIVGFEGATGNVTGEHLHFEVQINGTAVNPRPYITSEPAYNNGSVCG